MTFDTRAFFWFAAFVGVLALAVSAGVGTPRPFLVVIVVACLVGEVLFLTWHLGLRNPSLKSVSTFFRRFQNR